MTYETSTVIASLNSSKQLRPEAEIEY